MAQPDLKQLAEKARAWPFEEARKLVERYKANPPEKGYVLFETGYGPSGLPHIGTFGEVARTTMVRQAFMQLSDIPTRLICFSDDMDGLRKVPDNIPNQDKVSEHLGKPLTRVPDPFEEYESFGHHNNAMLRRFLDSFGFEYEFYSATDCYTSGQFNSTLQAVLDNYEAVRNVVLPTLGPDRRKTYSPFLPVCPKTGIVLQAKVVATDPAAGTITYEEEDGSQNTVPVIDGHCKLQWKADWGMRWVALGVDYEMAGKDLIDSVKLSSQIAKILGARPPEGFNYELFLDDKGQKISKSKGNGLTIDEWLRYAPPESLSLFMFNAPRKAKRLYFDVIPRQVDDWLTFLQKYAELGEQEASGELSAEEAAAKRLENPASHIHGADVPPPLVLQGAPISFAMLLNLASACNAEDKSVLWGFISRYAPDATPDSKPLLDILAGYAVAYFHDFVKPGKTFRAPTDQERAAMEELKTILASLPADTDAGEIQNRVFEIGKKHEFENLRDWFKALYEVLLGQSQGPRFGSFVALYGISETIALIEKGLAGELTT